MNPLRDVDPRTTARVARWAEDPSVLGVLLVGSKSRGHDDGGSDDDLEVLLAPAAYAALDPADCSELLREDGGEGRIVYDAEYLGLTELEGRVDSAFDLDHWPYERARILFDRDGRVAAATAALAALDPAFRLARLRHGLIDAASASRRAEKTLARGAGEGAARMLVARGAKALVRVVFALEHRWAPLDHWLEAELRTLEDRARAGARIVEALATGRPAPLLAALDDLGPRLEREGLPPREGRLALFLELIHPRHAAERAIHGLP